MTSWKSSSNGNVPEFAVYAGFDKKANCSIYVCRVDMGDELVLGKVAPSDGGCAFVLQNGQEKQVTEYEVLTDPEKVTKWLNLGDDGGIPWGAMPGGYDKNRMTKFIARGYIPSEGVVSQSCGEYIPQTKKCLLPWATKEIEATSFELLVEKVIEQ